MRLPLRMGSVSRNPFKYHSSNKHTNVRAHRKMLQSARPSGHLLWHCIPQTQHCKRRTCREAVGPPTAADRCRAIFLRPAPNSEARSDARRGLGGSALPVSGHGIRHRRATEAAPANSAWRARLPNLSAEAVLRTHASAIGWPRSEEASPHRGTLLSKCHFPRAGNRARLEAFIFSPWPAGSGAGPKRNT